MTELMCDDDPYPTEQVVKARPERSAHTRTHRQADPVDTEPVAGAPARALHSWTRTLLEYRLGPSTEYIQRTQAQQFLTRALMLFAIP